MTKYSTKVDVVMRFANGEVMHLVNYFSSEESLELVDAEVALYSLDQHVKIDSKNTTLLFPKIPRSQFLTEKPL